MSQFKKLFRKIFLTKEILSQQGELHFRRWRIFETPTLSLYYHQIFRSDEDRHCHSHPWNFASLILSGGYHEYDQTDNLGYKEFLPGSLNYHQAEDFHHLSLLEPTTTLVLTFGTRREWGYYVDGKMIPHQEYRHLKRQGKV
jgi:hypothetical protein